MSTMSPSQPADDVRTARESAGVTAFGGWWRSLGRDWQQTLKFLLGATACLALSAAFEYSNRPAEINEFGRVGEEFYPEFTDPTLAASLEVFVFDKDNVVVRDFHVKQAENGRWVIPSHHGYPADAENQLAQTASSVIGIRRGAMVTRWEADHARFGVVNPKQQSLNVEEVEGVGSRIILRTKNDSVLADYIIGEKVDGESGQFYVRHPEEDEVYIASLDIDLSTKFTDWIETDLLDVFSSDFVEVRIHDYSFDELKGSITASEVSTLNRESSADPWTLEGLDAAAEEVDKDAIRETINALADLSIVGVRPRQNGLTSDLKLDRTVLNSQNQVDRLQSDLLTRGFLLQQDEESGDLKLIAREGELHAATDDGLVYRLHFGRAFAGSEEELEIGFTSNDDNGPSDGSQDRSSDSSAAAVDDASASAADSSEVEQDSAESESTDAATDGSSESTSDESSDSRPGRYVFVSVDFDESYLGEAPVRPTEPEKPAELAAENDAAEAKPEAGNADESSDSDAGQSSDESAEPSDGESDSDDPLNEIRKTYEDAVHKYEQDLKDYEKDLEDREKKIADGKRKAEQLNRRFAEWYYVIPGDDFEKVRVSRADIVKLKEVEDGDGDGDVEGEKEKESLEEPQSTGRVNSDSDTPEHSAVDSADNAATVGEESSNETDKSTNVDDSVQDVGQDNERI